MNKGVSPAEGLIWAGIAYSHGDIHGRTNGRKRDLASGSVFFLFGIILFLFADDGKLTLQWNGEYWIYFFSLSFPIFFLGWKYLQKDLEL